MIYSFIMCAGKQSRFQSETPKALMKIGDKTILENNIEQSLKYCDKVVVVASIENYKYFESYKNDKIDVIQIISGFGCGDAVYKALNFYYTTKKDACFIIWGDSIQHDKRVFLYSILNYNNNIIIPVEYQNKPYVQIKHTHLNAYKVLFSKYGDYTYSGWHDLSIFFGNCNILRKKLDLLKRKIYNNGKYFHKHNNELLFLDIINEVPGNYKIIPISDYKDYSFNTLEQYIQLKKII